MKTENCPLPFGFGYSDVLQIDEADWHLGV
jgi:hypothetical protein